LTRPRLAGFQVSTEAATETPMETTSYNSTGEPVAGSPCYDHPEQPMDSDQLYAKLLRTT
jgi:hypothetical protein